MPGVPDPAAELRQAVLETEELLQAFRLCGTAIRQATQDLDFEHLDGALAAREQLVVELVPRFARLSSHADHPLVQQVLRHARAVEAEEHQTELALAASREQIRGELARDDAAGARVARYQGGSDARRATIDFTR